MVEAALISMATISVEEAAKEVSNRHKEIQEEVITLFTAASMKEGARRIMDEMIKTLKDSNKQAEHIREALKLPDPVDDPEEDSQNNSDVSMTKPETEEERQEQFEMVWEKACSAKSDLTLEGKQELHDLPMEYEDVLWHKRLFAGDKASQQWPVNVETTGTIKLDPPRLPRNLQQLAALKKKQQQLLEYRHTRVLEPREVLLGLTNMFLVTKGYSNQWVPGKALEEI